jgi:hypothetical protein
MFEKNTKCKNRDQTFDHSHIFRSNRTMTLTLGLFGEVWNLRF